MTATGIIRRVDDLGRIAIPKEIRRSLGVEEGSAMEIFVDSESKALMLQKYDTIEDATNYIVDAVRVLEENNTHEDYRKVLNAIVAALKSEELS